jgi:hypothetical protein
MPGCLLGWTRIADGLAGVGELHLLGAAHAEDPGQVAVGIETARGLLVGALLAALGAQLGEPQALAMLALAPTPEQAASSPERPSGGRWLRGPAPQPAGAGGDRP